MLNSQVQVSKEPHHRMVIENEYIRLLDVWIEPGDTSLFHVHSTPSVFVQYTNTSIATQVKGEKWINEQSTTGKSWFNAFSPDKLVHRVSNIDTASFHVVDVELLKAYDADQSIPDLAMTWPLLFENEKVYVYKITDASLVAQQIVGRGPIVANLISGGPLVFHSEFTGETDEIRKGQFKFVEPGAFFNFTTEGKGEIHMVLFELK